MHPQIVLKKWRSMSIWANLIPIRIQNQSLVKFLSVCGPFKKQTKWNKNLLKIRSWSWNPCYYLRRKGGPSDVCVSVHMCRNGLFGPYPLCQGCCFFPLSVPGWLHPMCQQCGIKCATALQKTQKHRTHPKHNDVFLKSQVASCPEYAFFVWGGEGLKLLCMYNTG